MSRTPLRFRVEAADLNVSAVMDRPDQARWLLALGHGAGAGMHHPFMAEVAGGLADRGMATLRYQFPYMERGGGRPDRHAVLLTTVRAAAREAHRRAPDLPLLAGGKSMGGRLTSMAAAREPLDGVRGIIFFGFPLHPPGRPSVERAEHLTRVELPMLFLQGTTRDRLTDLGLLRPLLDRLGGWPTLHVVDDADHGFAVPKRAGRTRAEVLEELTRVVVRWASGLEDGG